MTKIDILSIEGGSSPTRLTERDEELLARILDDYLESLESGKPMNIDHLCEGAPHLADTIRSYVRSIRALHGIGLPAHKEYSQSSSQMRLDSIESSFPSMGAIERGTRLGDFELIRELGRGGMGVVFEARQISLDRKVAVKTLPFAAVLDSRQIARFQNEARAAALLQHSNIVPVYSIGNDRGTYFYSMQYIDGPSLDQVIGDLQFAARRARIGVHENTLAFSNVSVSASTMDAVGAGASAPTIRAMANYSEETIPIDYRRLSASPSFQSFVRGVSSSDSTNSVRKNNKGIDPFFRRIAEIGVQAAEAIQYAHDNGIVHRDIKPSNLLFDADGKVWVADFGLAQCQHFGNLTQSGDLIGTLRFMSPEQANGQNQLVDHRSDIYSLGATLFEFATLHRVVDGTDRASILKQLDRPTPPSLRRLNSNVPIDFENIIRKTLARSKEDRYESAGALAADLKSFLNGEIPKAKRLTLIDSLHRWVKYNSHYALAAVTIAILFFCGTLSALWWTTQTNMRISQANAKAEKHLSIAKEILDRFGSNVINQLESIPGSEEIRKDIAANAIEYLESFVDYAKDNQSYYEELGRAHLKLATLNEKQNQVNEAKRHYEIADKILSEVLFNRKLDTAMMDWAVCQNNYTNLLFKNSDPDKSLVRLRSQIQLLDQWIVSHPDSISISQLPCALMHSTLAGNLLTSHRNNQAVEELRLALRGIAARLSNNQIQSNECEEAVRLVASVAIRFAELDPSDETLDRIVDAAINMIKNILPCDVKHVNNAYILGHLNIVAGQRAMRAHRWQSAEIKINSARELFEPLHERHPHHPTYAKSLAVVWSALGQICIEDARHVEGENYLVRALEKLNQMNDPSAEKNELLSGVLHNLCIASHLLGHISEGNAFLDKAIQTQQDLLESDKTNQHYRTTLESFLETAKKMQTTNSVPICEEQEMIANRGPASSTLQK